MASTESKAVLEFTEVASEFRHLVGRRRRQLLFLFSVVTALSVVIEGIASGSIDAPLGLSKSDAFASISIVGVILSGLSALRDIRLHRGMLINGRLLSGCIAKGDFPQSLDAVRSRFGVSKAAFVLSLLTGVAAWMLYAGTIGLPWLPTVCLALVFCSVLVRYLMDQKRETDAIVARKLAIHSLGDATRAEWREHLVASMDDVHQDMLEFVAVVGLVTFSGLQLLAGISEWSIPMDGRRGAALGVSVYMLFTSIIAGMAYLRLRGALVFFSVQLDQTDVPFRDLELDDSFLGLLTLGVGVAINGALVLRTFAEFNGLMAEGLVFLATIASVIAVDRVWCRRVATRCAGR